MVNTLEIGDLELRQATRNQLIATLLARCPVNDEHVERAMMMDKRGEGVPVIMNESEQLSGKLPEYALAGEELQLTIYAATKS